MTYELAKQLKDTGFIQKENTYCSDDRGEGKLGVYIPTLSELIEACGIQFCELEKCIPAQLCSWRAHGLNKNGEIFKDGSTPEEAVANLWLELNKQ